MHEENPREPQRQAVIDLYGRYVKNRNTFKEHLNMGDGLDDEGIKDISDEVEKLKANKYLLAIVGESKSGKSAFINAFLGKPILPTGVLQCTSGIIEIVDTGNLSTEEKVYLKVSYGDQPANPKVEYPPSSAYDNTPLQKKLEKIAALQEEYRALPQHQLNQFLLDKRPAQITQPLVEEFCSNALKEAGNNPHKLSKEDFAQRVCKYLEEYRDLTRIPVNIWVGYPVGLKFAHIRIVDTPGVNARGGLKTATLNAIDAANAVIFIHLVKNIASESLQEFIKESVTKKSQQNTFMFLTHKAHSTKEGIEETLKEAKKLYPEIKAERVIAIDSMLKQIADELAAGKSLKDLRQEEERKKLIADYILDYDSDVTKIREVVFADSNFKTAQTLLTDFSEQALVGQLRWVVQQIATGYEQQRIVYDEHIRLISWRDELNRTPEQFDSEIKKLSELLEDYKARLNDFSRQKSEEYKGRHSTVNQTFSTMKEVYNKLLGGAGNEDQVRKHIMDFNDECESKVTRLTTGLRKEYQAEMERVGEEFKEEHQINPPKINLETISKEAKKQAYETITIPGDRTKSVIGGILAGALLGAFVGLGALAAGPVGAVAGAQLAAAAGIGAGAGAAGGGAVGYFEGTPTKTESRFSDKKFREAMISEAKNLVISITDGMPEAIGNLFGSYDKQFKEKLGHLITERQNAYEQLKKDKEDAEKFRQLEVVNGELEEIEGITKKLSAS